MGIKLIRDFLPSNFAPRAAYGDLASGLLALASLVALHGGFRFALALTAGANVAGFADLALALWQASVIPQLGVAWFIPTFVVPVRLATHYMMITRLYCMARRHVLGAAAIRRGQHA